MDINFPRHKKTKRSLALFIVKPFAVSAILMAFGMAIWFSVLLGFLTLAFVFYFKVVRYRKSHSEFLDSFGSRIENSRFYEKEYVIGVVPFSNRFMSCCARLEGKELFFGRSRHYRALDLEQIKDMEIVECLGHDVAKLRVQGNTQGQPLYVPWSRSLADQVEIENGI